jgi:methionyl-tRNA synthetase
MTAKFYVTTPIYYVNAAPHMGTGYTTILCDVLTRFHRRNGVDARLVTGADEHSQGIADLAAAAGIPPREYCDRFIPDFQNAWKLLEIGPYEFYRTSSPEHHRTVQAVMTHIHENGDIYKGQYSGWYHTTDNRFLPEDEVPEEPEKDPKLKHLTEDAYFFRLSKYKDFLLDFHEKNPRAIVPDFRRNEMLNRLKGEVRDLCISRTSTDWGVPIPWDTDHVFYVWADALLTYMTGSGFDAVKACEAIKNGQDPLSVQGPDNYWPAQLHVMAKDIPWFHTIIWPAILQAAGLPLPLSCLVHGYWNFDGAKMSKSLGNVFHPKDAVALVGAAGVRYFVLREAPVGSDGNFSVKALADRYNYDLANDFGNLVYRLMTMGERFRQGRITPDVGDVPEHQALLALSQGNFESALGAFAELRYKDALEHTWELVKALNKLIDDEKPWSLNKAKNEGDAERLDSFFAVSFIVLRQVLGLLSPIMPGATATMHEEIGYPESRFWPELSWDDFRQPPVTAWHLGKATILFPKLDLDNLDEELATRKGESVSTESATPKTEVAKSEAPPQETKPSYIGYEDWAKVKIIAVKVLKAEAVDKSDKLLRLTVDDGQRQDRVIVSGIRKDYAPEDMADRTIFIIDNLEPRKIFGILSEGMLVAAGGQGSPVTLVQPSAELAPGTPVS